MKLFLMANLFTPVQRVQAMHAVSVLETVCNYTVSLSPEDSSILFGTQEHTTFSAGESDLIVALGGDGAVLRAAQLALTANKPLLGVNSGRVGYLSALEYEGISSFPEVFSQLNPRRCFMLEFSYEGTTYYALNDVIIGKKNFGNTVSLDVGIDCDMTHMRGDGVIVSTPIGSTAYSFSAGGPIIEPDLNAIVLTPICPHNVHNKPLVLNSHRILSFTERCDSAVIYADGKFITDLHGSFSVKVSERMLMLYVREGSVFENIIRMNEKHEN